MDTVDAQQLPVPVNTRSLQSAHLPALADEASRLTSQHEIGAPFEPSDAPPFQSFQPSIADLESIGHLQPAGIPSSKITPAFIRPPRPGEPANNQFIQRLQPHPRQQQQHDSHHHAEQPPHGDQPSSASGGPEIHDLRGEDGQTQFSIASSAGVDLGNALGSDVPQPDGLPTAMEGHPFDTLQSSEQALQQASGAVSDEYSGTTMRLVPDPPDLEEWRKRLFDVNETIILSEEQFQTYFPHVDNVYSHRSTQKYKRKPFISHYWDCRLKGRPPGTPKSNDPNKRKRKRTARQRDLCDVKIKITEYFPGAGFSSDEFAADATLINNASGLFTNDLARETQPFGILTPNPALPAGHPGAKGERYFTVQRVNGNNGNGKNDGVGGGHRHTLEESDRVKKNSVQRYLMNSVKQQKKKTQKTYHTKATGLAALTVKNHSKDADLKLYGSCFCPFVQRVWVALELKDIPYQYIEIDPYKKPESLLAVNPRGLVPALRHGDWGCYESTVLLEYLEDLNTGTPLLPPGDPKLRAHCRLWADHINRHIVPNFYRVLQEQDRQQQISAGQELRDKLEQLVQAAHPQGPFFLGPQISFVDVQITPWIIRLSRVLKPYRGWPDPEVGSRWAAWVSAIESNEHVQATTSCDELYLDSYERYAQNRPNTSQVANAINSGSGLP